MNEIQPIAYDKGGRPYYFGTEENPFNFRVIREPIRSLEVLRLIANGGVIKSSAHIDEISHKEDQARILDVNVKLREKLSPLLGKLPLESSDQQTPLEDHRAA